MSTWVAPEAWAKHCAGLPESFPQGWKTETRLWSFQSWVHLAFSWRIFGYVWCILYGLPIPSCAGKQKDSGDLTIECWCLLYIFFGQNWSLCAGFVEEHCFCAGLLGFMDHRPWLSRVSEEGFEAPVHEWHFNSKVCIVWDLCVLVWIFCFILNFCIEIWADSSAMLCKSVWCCVPRCVGSVHVTCTCDYSLCHRDGKPLRAASHLFSSFLLWDLWQRLVHHFFSFGGPVRMCRVIGMGGFESNALGRAKLALQPLLGEGAIFGAHVRFSGLACRVLQKPEAVGQTQILLEPSERWCSLHSPWLFSVSIPCPHRHQIYPENMKCRRVVEDYLPWDTSDSL